MKHHTKQREADGDDVAQYQHPVDSNTRVLLQAYIGGHWSPSHVQLPLAHRPTHQYTSPPTPKFSTNPPIQITMSGLMEKAKSSLQGNDKAQGFADKQVNSRTVSSSTSLRTKSNKANFCLQRSTRPPTSTVWVTSTTRKSPTASTSRPTTTSSPNRLAEREP